MIRTLMAGAMALTCMTFSPPATAQEAFIGEIRMVGMNWCPRNWTPAAGQILPINQHQALFSLLGTIYGGDGRTTFALPDLRGRAPISAGQGPGLPSYRVGQKVGATQHTLTGAEMPAHNHTMAVTSGAAETDDPDGQILATAQDDTYASGNPSGTLAGTAISNNGGGQSFSIQDPSLTVTFCIALQGIYPSRN